MKKMMVFLLFALVAGAQFATPYMPVITWSEATNSYSTNMAFLVTYTTNLAVPLPQWTLFTNCSATNIASTNGGNYNYSVSVSLAPGSYFFTVQASNMWGTAYCISPLNVETDPALAFPAGLEIH